MMEEVWDDFLEPLIDDSFFDLSAPAADEYTTEWSLEEDKQFERAVAELDPSCPNFFEDLASRVPFKTIKGVKIHYQALIEDVEMIEGGLIEPPQYVDDQCVFKATENGGGSSSNLQIGTGDKSKKKIPWTAEEHRRFLKGLETYGKGRWLSISKYCVLTKTRTQVASHAQKYFRRMETLASDEKRRRSINDIQNVTSTTTTIIASVPPPEHENPVGENPLPFDPFPYNMTSANSSLQQNDSYQYCYRFEPSIEYYSANFVSSTTNTTITTATTPTTSTIIASVPPPEHENPVGENPIPPFDPFLSSITNSTITTATVLNPPLYHMNPKRDAQQPPQHSFFSYYNVNNNQQTAMTSPTFPYPETSTTMQSSSSSPSTSSNWFRRTQ